MSDAPEEKKVWIACRAKEGCPGNYAVITNMISQNPAPGMGVFHVASGGKIVRYRCCTCKGMFTICT